MWESITVSHVWILSVNEVLRLLCSLPTHNLVQDLKVFLSFLYFQIFLALNVHLSYESHEEFACNHLWFLQKCDFYEISVFIYFMCWYLFSLRFRSVFLFIIKNYEGPLIEFRPCLRSQHQNYKRKIHHQVKRAWSYHKSVLRILLMTHRHSNYLEKQIEWPKQLVAVPCLRQTTFVFENYECSSKKPG